MRWENKSLYTYTIFRAAILSRLTYAADVFEETRTKIKLQSLRGAIARTMAGAFVTASIEAVSAFANVPPLEMLIQKCLNRVRRKRGHSIRNTALEDVNIRVDIPADQAIITKRQHWETIPSKDGRFVGKNPSREEQHTLLFPMLQGDSFKHTFSTGKPRNSWLDMGLTLVNFFTCWGSPPLLTARFAIFKP